MANEMLFENDEICLYSVKLMIIDVKFPSLDVLLISRQRNYSHEINFTLLSLTEV